MDSRYVAYRGKRVIKYRAALYKENAKIDLTHFEAFFNLAGQYMLDNVNINLSILTGRPPLLASETPFRRQFGSRDPTTFPIRRQFGTHSAL